MKNRLTRVSPLWEDKDSDYQKYTFGDYKGLHNQGPLSEVITKLAAYENTGLSPNEIACVVTAQAKIRASQVTPGSIFRHFKGREYVVLYIAMHTETEEPLVIYRPLYDESKVYARPLPNFIEPLDLDKYPEATQQFRFIPVID